MSTRALTVLSIITSIAIIAAALTVWVDARQERPAEPLPLIPGLQERLNDITRIVLTDGPDTLTLERTESGWVLAEQGGYPARIADIRTFLIALADMTRTERKSSRAEHMADLGLDQGPLTARLTLHAGDTTLADLWIGNTTPRGSGRYVRLEGEDAAWISSKVFAIDPSVSAWTSTDLMRLGSDFIRSIRVESPDQPVFVITSQPIEPTPDQPGVRRKFAIEPMPPGREIGSDFELDRVFSALAFLTFTDVRPVEARPIPESATRLLYTTTTGSEFAVRYWRESPNNGPADHWIVFEFQRSADQNAPARPLEGWAYRVTPFAAEGFSVRIDDLTFDGDEDALESMLGPMPNLDGP